MCYPTYHTCNVAIQIIYFNLNLCTILIYLRRYFNLVYIIIIHLFWIYYHSVFIHLLFSVLNENLILKHKKFCNRISNMSAMHFNCKYGSHYIPIKDRSLL